NTATEGIPMMRPMILSFPDDPACVYLDRQYMLGDSLLVAPVFSENGSVSYYLPEGEWTNFITGKTLSGGHWVNECHDYMSLPLMVKAGTIIPVGSERSKPDYDYLNNICFHLFDLADSMESQRDVSLSDASYGMTLHVTRKSNILTFIQKGSTKPWSVCLRGINSISSTSAGTKKESRNGIIVSVPGGTATLEIAR
ncbi:MAG: hypothetical protein JXR67_05290, partial [Bacteroidales bacterium]|nr:hypothetical protein [Bacteroidales bacterium]